MMTMPAHGPLRLLGHELAGAHDGSGIGRLVGAGQDHRLDVGGQAGVDYVLRSGDIRQRGFERVVLARFDMLERRAMEYDVDSFGRSQDSVPVADVSDEEADVSPVAILLALIELLGFVSAQDPDDLRPQRQEMVDQTAPDRP